MLARGVVAAADPTGGETLSGLLTGLLAPLGELGRPLGDLPLGDGDRFGGGEDTCQWRMCREAKCVKGEEANGVACTLMPTLKTPRPPTLRI